MFNPNDHLMKIGYGNDAKDYLQVMWRLVWFREQCPQGTIDTEEIYVDLDREVEALVSVWNAEKRRSEKVLKQAKGYARFRAIVSDGKGGRATGTKSENAASFDDYIEKAETGAIGRALAGLGYGTQFAPELDEQERIVDSPVERTSTPGQSVGSNAITAAQLKSIQNLCKLLGKQVTPDVEALSNQTAKEEIARLSKLWQKKQFEDSQKAS